MKKIVRSSVYSDTAEKVRATENLGKVRQDRLVNLSKSETEVIEFTTSFYANHGEAPSLNYTYDYFEQANNSEAVTLIEEVTAETFYEGASFEALFEEEVEDQASQSLARVCKEAIKISTTGMTINRTVVKGTDEAVAHLFSSAQTAPKNDDGKLSASMKKNNQALTDLYSDRKNNPNQSYGIYTGYGLFDQSTAGLRKKQFYLHAGFGGHLKSTLMFNMILNAACDGWNPLLFTSEMPAEDVQQLLICMHSAAPKFNGVGKPLNSFRLLLGSLTDEEEKFYGEVKEDLINNPNHGLIRVIDSGDFTTFGSVMQRTIRENVDEEVDILWVDYITRLPVDTKYRGMDITSARNETLADAKRFSMGFNKGEGLPVCSPFQINREGYRKAKTTEGKMDKCQTLTTPILTPNGWESLGNIKEGDYVFGRNGKPTKVLKVSRPGVKKTYRVYLKDKTSTVTCADHLWLVRRVDDKKGFVIKETQELTRDHVLCNLEPIQFSEKDFSIPPYLIGVLLGDGSLSGGLASVLSGAERASQMERAIKECLTEDLKITTHIMSNGVRKFDIVKASGKVQGENKFSSKIKALGMWGKTARNKRVPPEYLLGSVQQREALIQGLMDTDGCVSARECSFTSVSEGLVDDLAELVQSLGGSCTKTWKNRITNRGACESWVLRISTPPSIALTKIKDFRGRPMRYSRSIDRVEEEGEEEVACILVEDPEHLYVTENYIVTHNTALAMYNAAEKEADIISYIYYDDEEAATSEPKIGLMKSRWGAVPADPISVYIEPDSRRIFDLTAGMGAATGYAPTAGGSAEEEVEL